MPTSDGVVRERRWARTALKALAALALLVALDVALTFALEPYGSFSEVIWHDWARDERPIDTVVIGSSVALDALRPDELDDALGCTSFNLASPGQSLYSSYESLKKALDEKPIRRVLLGTSHTQLFDIAYGPNDMAITQARIVDAPPAEKVATYARLVLDRRYLGTIASLGFLAPWTLNHVGYTPSAIAGNVRSRLTCQDVVEAHALDEPGKTYLGAGFMNLGATADFSRMGVDRLVAARLEHVVRDGVEPGYLERICALCEERGIELVVFVTPVPACTLLMMQDMYADDMAAVADVARSHGATWLDFNMAKPETYEAVAADFADELHLNTTGATRFTPALGELVARVEGGEDVSSGFFAYGEWGDWMAGIDDVAFAYLESQEAEGGLSLTATALTGSATPREYEVSVLDEATGSWEVAFPWSYEETRTLPLEGYGTLQTRLDVRFAGTEEPAFTHYQTVTYQCP